MRPARPLPAAPLLVLGVQVTLMERTTDGLINSFPIIRKRIYTAHLTPEWQEQVRSLGSEG